MGCARRMVEPNYKRAYYCLKKWVDEIEAEAKEEKRELRKEEMWIVQTCHMEIFSGKYLEDDEYNEILLGYDK